MKKHFAKSLLVIFTMLIGAAFTNGVSARTTVDDLIFGNTNKSAIDILSPQAAATIVNYDFNTNPCTPAAATTATNVTSTFSKSASFTTCASVGGVATTAAAFTQNTAGTSPNFSGLATSTTVGYLQFQLGGTALSTYSAYKIYFQSQKSSSGPGNGVIQYSTDGTNFTDFTTFTVTTTNTAFVFDLSTGAAATALNGASSVYFRVAASGATGSGGTFRIDNFEVQADNGAAAGPTVNLSVSSNSASEATPGTTVTVTATLSAAQSTDTTVTLGTSGSATLNSDYTLSGGNLSGTTLTIPANSTTGTTTFTVIDDTEIEGTENAVLTISAPSTGVTLGTTTTQTIAIADNDVAANPDLTISQSAPATAPVNGTLTYTLTVTDSGAAVSSAFDATFVLPASGYTNATVVSKGCFASSSITGTTVTFTGCPSLALNATSTMTVSITPTTTGVLSSGNAMVDSGSTITESDETNNTAAGVSTTVNPAPTGIVINEVYGGGSNSGATYNADYIELYNNGTATVDLSGYSLQYASVTGSFSATQVIALPSTAIAPGTYYLVQTQAAGSTGAALTPNFTSTNSVNIAAGGGNVLLAAGTTAVGTCPAAGAANVLDRVGFGSTANCSETSPAPAPTGNTTSVQRIPNGVDSNDNSADFKVAPGTPGAVNVVPTITVNPTGLTFGNVTVNTASSPQSYTLTGSNLAGNITVTAPTGYTVSTTQGGTYAQSLTVTPTNGSVNATIYVIFTPTSATTFGGNITNASSSATTQNVAVSGTGVAAADNPPTIMPASGVSVVRGTTQTGVTIATVTDDGGNGNVAVTITSNNPSSGVTISNIQNNAGTITADITADCGAGASAFFTLSASDGVNAAVTAQLGVSTTDSTVPTHIVFGQQPTSINSGATISPAVTVLGLNACNTVATGFNGTVTLSLNGSGGTLGGTTTQTATNGTATFNDLTVTSATDASFTLTATSAGFANVTSFSFNVAGSTPTVNLSIAPGAGSESEHTTFTATVTASGNVSSNQTVNFALTSGTAGTADFTLIPATITIQAGSNTGTATFSVVDDTIYEGTENATFTISSPSSGISLGTMTTATVSITDNDSQPSLSIGNVSQNEGNSGTTAFNFTVTLSNPTTQDVTVNYSTSDGTATVADGDYQAVVNGTVTIPAGSTTGTATVQVNGDTTNEPDETFTVALSNPVNATINVSPGTGTILNDDAAVPGTIQFNPTAYTSPENGSVMLTVTRAGGSNGAVSVNYSLTDGTATGGSSCTPGVDYINTGGTVNFADGSSTAQTISVSICPDAIDEVNEDFTVTLYGPAGGATLGANNTATVTITDDDTAGVTVNPTTVNVTEGGATAIYSVVLNSQPTSDVSINLFPDSQVTVSATACNTAPTRMPNGFTAVPSLTLTFTPANYNTPQCVRVTAVDDTAVEGNHTGTVSQTATSSDANYNGIAVSPVTANITDNDSATPTVTLGNPSCTGLAPSPLPGGTRNQAILCFSLDSSTTTDLTNVRVDFTANPSQRFTNPRLYSSADSNFATIDYAPTLENAPSGSVSDTKVATGYVNSTNIVFPTVNELNAPGEFKPMPAPELAAGTTYFFVVVDVLNSVDASTPQSQPSVSTSGITVTGATVNGTTAAGTNYAFAPAVPTAATVAVGGRLTRKLGIGIESATVTMTDSEGNTRTTVADGDGYYRFADVPVGQTLIFSAHARAVHFRQPTLVVFLSEETLTVDFTAAVSRGGE